MNPPPPSTVPPGWYPDPSGDRQWRVWTGTAWSQAVRPYGERVVATSLVESIPLINALHRLVRYGIVALFGGLGLVVSALAHWPHTHQPTPLWFAETATDAGLTLLVVATTLFAFAARELQGRWTPWALVPGLNVLVTSALVLRRLDVRSYELRLAMQAVLIALFVASAHRQPWLCVAPALVAFDQMLWTTSLVEQLCATAPVRTSSAP